MQSAARWASACDYHDRDAADRAVSVAVVNHELTGVRSGRKTERAHIPNVFGRELLWQRGAGRRRFHPGDQDLRARRRFALLGGNLVAVPAFDRLRKVWRAAV